MPVDHYRMSMEAKPLRLLYSKYAPQAPLSTGSVRPLGSVRRCDSPVHEENTISLSQLEGEVSKAERVQRYLAMSGGGQGLMDMYGSRKSLHSLAGTSDNSKSNRSRSQDFENKYKIAVSRDLQDQKAPNIYNKKVIHLPLLKINLETYVGDTEDSRALESTRKSLRHILDVGRKPNGPPVGICVSGVKPAGITQYQFKTPGEIQKEALRLPTNHQSPAFDKVPIGIGHISHKHEENKTGLSEEQDSTLRLESVNDDVRTTSSSDTLYGADVIEEEPEWGEWEGEGVEVPFERDMDNSSVKAQRLSSAATLGTSYRYLDVESFSSDAEGTDLLRLSSRQRTGIEGMDALDANGELPVWPSFNDVRNLRPELGHACLAIRPRMPREVRLLERGSSVIMQKSPPDSFVIRNGVIPKLKYTTHYNSKPQPKRKLQPIVSAPHTERECPMCNLFKVKEPTPCPPNTPRHPGDLLPEILTHINQDSLGEVKEEPEGENDIDETDRSDIEFRKRHKLLNYDVNDINNSPHRLQPIDKRNVVAQVTGDHKSESVHAKTAR